MLTPWEESYAKLESILKSRDITLPTKVHLVKTLVFPIVMYGCELDFKESWVLKNWCFWTVVLEKTFVSPLDCKEIQAVHPKGNQSWLFIGKTDVEAEAPILWPPETKSQLTWKDPDAGRDWGQEKRTTEDEMAGWHHLLDGCESEWTPGFGDGQAGLACCDSWGHKESDATEQLNWTELMVFPVVVYGCKSWTIKKAERQRIEAFELWCWRRLLRVPWTARISNQSILKEISPEYSLERLMLKLKLQYFCHLMQRTDTMEKTLMVEKVEGRRRRGQQRTKWLDGITDTQWTWVWANSRIVKEKPGAL